DADVAVLYTSSSNTRCTALTIGAATATPPVTGWAVNVPATFPAATSVTLAATLSSTTPLRLLDLGFATPIVPPAPGAGLPTLTVGARVRAGGLAPDAAAGLLLPLVFSTVTLTATSGLTTFDARLFAIDAPPPAQFTLVTASAPLASVPSSLRAL